LISNVYSQSCNANAGGIGGNLDITLTHDGSPGGEVEFDGSATTGDNLGDFQWNIYHLPEDTLAYTVNGANPTIDIMCYTSQNGDGTWTDCLADYRVVLTVTCDDDNDNNDTINLSIIEENDPPLACLTMESDSYLSNDDLLVPNNNGIPGEQTNVLLYSYIEFGSCTQSDSDLRSWLWYDSLGVNVAPVAVLGEGVHVYTHRVKDPYETYGEIILTLELDEENIIPTVSIAAIDVNNEESSHTVIDGEQINLFGTITDIYNDIDDVDGDGTEDDIIYSWNYTVVPNESLTIDNSNPLSPIITAPSISNNTESTEITITLEAEDPFQILDEESTVSDPIVITVVNDNTPPVITNTDEGYQITEGGSSELNYSNIDAFINVSDTDENIFSLVINQSDIDLDPITYANYSLIGSTTIVPNDDYYGQITVPIRLDDGYIVSDTCYHCLSDIADLVIDVIGVNDAPILIVPEALTTNEDIDLTITSISVDDVDAELTGPNNFNLEFQITIEKGTLSLSSNTGSINYSLGDGIEDEDMIFTASVTDFNNALSGAIFHPENNYYGSNGQIILAVNDLGNNGIQDGDDPIQLTDNKTINITINNVNDAPIITSSENYNITEDDNDFYLGDITFSDEDVADNQMIVELTVLNGVLELSSTDDIICLGSGNCYGAENNMEFRGTLSILNNSINNLHYIPNDNYNGSDVLEIRLNDMGNIGDEELEDIKNINIDVSAVNDSPIITSGGFFSSFEDSLFNIENITIQDVDVDEGDGLLEISIGCSECKVSLALPLEGISVISGNTFESNSMVFRGSLNNINNAVSNLGVTGNENFCGLTNLQITANDLGNYSIAATEETHIVNISIDFEQRNDPPVNQDPLTSQEVPPIVTFSEDALSLNTSNGLWNDLIDEQCGPASIITYEYQWQKTLDTTDVISDINGANLNIYQITSDDADHYLRSRIIATDDGWGLPPSQSDTSYSFFVKMDNLPPYILSEFSTVIQTSYEDSLYVLNLSTYVEDPDDNDVTFLIDNDVNENYGSILLNETTGEVQFTPSLDINFDSIGNFVEFSYRVADFQYTSADQGIVKIKILPRNDAPIFSIIDNGTGDISVEENQEIITPIPWADPLSIDCGDEEDPQNLEFLIESISNESLFNTDGSGNPIIAIDSFSGELIFELVDNANGSSDIEVILKDDGGTNNYPGLDVSEFDTSESFQFTIDVMAVNNPPIFIGGTDIIINEDNGPFNLESWATNIDDGDPELTQQYEFELTVLGDFNDMFLDLPQISNTGELLFTTAENANGEVSIEVILNDNGSNVGSNIDLSEPDIFTITINPVNDIPTFSIDLDDLTIGDPIAIYEDSGLQTIQDFAKDIYDGDPLLNSADIQDVEFVLVGEVTNSELFSVLPYIDDNGTLTFTAAENQNGSSDVTVMLTDLAGTPNSGIDESVPQTFNIAITPLNDPPFFNLEHEGFQLADGEELVRLEDFSNPSSILILPIASTPPEDEQSPLGANAQTVTYEIELTESINSNGDVLNANGEPFVHLEVNPLGEITLDMIPDGNGQANFTVRATDTGPGEETGNGDINTYIRLFSLTVNPLGDHPEVDLNDTPVLIEPVFLKVDSLISVYHGTWIDIIDTDMSGTSNIIGYEYKWQAADSDNPLIEDIDDIGDFHADSSDYIITNNEAHRYIRSIVRAIDDGWGDLSFSTLDEDDRFTDTTDWVQVLNTKPVIINDLEYFTWEDSVLSVETVDGLIGLINRTVLDTTKDYDTDLDSIWVNDYDLTTAWGQLDIDPTGFFIFDPSPPTTGDSSIDNFQEGSDRFGTVNFTYEIIDEYGATSENLGQVQIEVGWLNDAPEFTIEDQSDGNGNAIDTIEVLEDFEEIKLGFSIIGHLPLDEAPPNQQVQYSINPSNVNFAEVTLDENQGSIQISAKEDWNGGQLFTVTALDDGPGIETGNGDDNDYEQTFYLKVVPVNDVPIFTMLPDTIILLEDRGVFDTLNWIIDSNVGAILEDSQNLTYNISYTNDEDVNGDIWTFNSNPQILNDFDLNFQASNNHNGLSEVIISIIDDGGTTVDYLENQDYEVGVDESEPQTFYIKVLPVNDRPTFSYGIHDTLDEDSGLITYENWITNISAGPSNESFQHDSLEFNIVAYDKFWNILNGVNSTPPNNILFKNPPILTIGLDDTTNADLSFELNDNHNGLSYLRFSLDDKGGTDYLGVEVSTLIEKQLYVRQISDESKSFIVHSSPHEYAIDSSTFFIDSTSVEYFRLPYQNFAPDLQIPEKMRFSWEKNDSLDVDTYLTTNLDTLLNTYYRLEMSTDSSEYTYVLFDFYKDSSEYIDNLFFNDTSYFIDIDMNTQFPAYLDTFRFDNSPYDTMLYIDTTGFTEYSWNIITQNYSRDIYNHDIVNSVTANRGVVIDLEVPIANYSFMHNDLYEEYYDLYFNTSEKTIEDVGSIWIDFPDTSIYRTPHKIDEYYFHLSSTFINTGIIQYNFQVRDLVENIGKSTKIIAFQFLENNLAKTVYSPDNLFAIHSSENSVNEKCSIILFSEDINTNSSENIQMSSEYHIYPYNKEFIEAINIEFNNINIEDDLWKYSIRKKEDEEWIEIDTEIKDHKISSEVISGGIYSIFYNPTALDPIPEKFELVKLYPNPFNPDLTIKYNLDFEQNISIDIYNILGQRVNKLIDQKMQAGYHSINWNGKNENGVSLGSGIYFIKVSTKEQSYVGKVSFIK